MEGKNVTTRYWIPLSLAVCFTISLLLRILPPYDQVFTDLGIKFALNDAYYHMRLIDNLVYNFPHFSYYDPYFVFPGTTVIGGAHFFDWLVASIVWVAGLGSPTQATIDIVGVYLPPVLAALLVIPVYFIGKSVFNKWVGIVATLLIAILPGEFLGRSILGAADHHVAEVLFSTTTIMFFILALKATTTRWMRVFAMLAGVFLGVYLLTWLGGLLFILIISLFLVIQVISNHLREALSARIAGVAGASISIAFLMSYSRTLSAEVILFFFVSIGLVVTLAILSHFMLKRQWHPAAFPSAIIGAGVVFLVGINWLYPSFTSYLGMFLPSGSTAATTMELQPMLFPHGQFTWSVLWGNFTTTAILAPIALVLLAILVIKDKGKDESKTLLVVWSAVMIALMLNQRRYAYYAVVNMGLLSAYLAYIATRYFAWTQVKQKGKVIARLSLTRVWLVLPIVALILVPTNLSASIQTARTATFAPPDAWQLAMIWMRDNTPEPFGDDLYGEYLPLLEEDLPEGEVSREFFTQNGKRYLASPTPEYTVSAWWDYGYWITKIGHRVPNANPAQNVEAIKRVASLLLSTGDSYREQVRELKSKYIVVDNAMVSGKFYAVASWGDKNSSDYFGVYRVPDKEAYKDIVLFYPEYYETLVSRLYNFNGAVVVPERTVVITYEGNIVSKAKEFTDHVKAQDYVNSTPNTRIVSADPTISPVPLGKMDHELVYSSTERANNMPEVKIFEYTGVVK